MATDVDDKKYYKNLSDYNIRTFIPVEDYVGSEDVPEDQIRHIY